jgi:hypothetical protein
VTADPLIIAAAVAVGVIAVARLTRLVVDDDFPPVAWLRREYMARANESWATLPTCAFCVAPYFTAGSLAWALLTDLGTAWWVFHGWLAVAYLASMLVVRDTPE